MRHSHRLPAGGSIQRDAPIEFRFNGKRYTGYVGDTLASALLANGVDVVARSFKYHRPRGIVTAGNDEPNALVQLTGDDDEPNVRATTLPLRQGLCAQSVNCWPGVGFDLGVVNDWLSPLLGAGFYYKTFMWPRRGWNLYGPLIRRMAGLGRAPTRAGSQHYERRNHHCDVLIVGAGVAGLSAALAASRAGVRIMLVDESELPGGAALSSSAKVDGKPVAEWIRGAVEELDSSDNCLRLAATNALGYYDHNLVTLVESRPAQAWVHERLWRVRAGQVVLATGALERPLVFANNDRPGIMLAGAVQTFIQRFSVRPGQRAVIVTNNDSAYAVVASLLDAGIEVVAFVDTRQSPADELVSQIAGAGIEYLAGHTVVDTHGRRRVRAVDVAPSSNPQRWRRLQCDLLACSGGWNPLVHLHSQSGGRPRYEPEMACFVPGQATQAQISVGSANGLFQLAAALDSGYQAGLAASGVSTVSPVFKVQGDPPYRIEPCWDLPSANARTKHFVDLQNDVTAHDIRTAKSEGFESVEHVKRYTTAGMGTDQGKLGNVNVVGVLAATRDAMPGDVGTTTYRPPYTPVSFGVIAGNDTGKLVLPSRRTAITDWLEAAGAVMFEAGAGYRRSSYFPKSGESADDAISREARDCRRDVGMYDGSPLGKFELNGPDVAEFLNRVYANRFDTLKIGRGRFGWMLKEDGRLLDDGVTFRLDSNRYLMFVGTGAADHVYMHLERLLQLEWPELEVYLTVVTSHWTNICVCGPNAKALLSAAGCEAGLDKQQLPFMSIRETRVAGHSAWLARIGYTGESSFEVNIRRRDGLALWEALYAAGASLGLTLIGSEASMVMRCEKGFVSAGFEGDGIVNPFDAGCGWAVDMEKGDFIGRRSLLRDLELGGVRPNVVGLLPDDPAFQAPDGTPLTEGLTDAGQPRVTGYVTQCVYSPTLERVIAMAVLDDGRNKLDQRITLHAIDRQVQAKVTRPEFIDASGERMRG